MNNSSTVKFVGKAVLLHNNRYDYSDVEYTSQIDKVTIICPIHGAFKQRPKHHLQGQGCPKCMYDNKRTGTQNFIKDSAIVHSNKYDYSKVEYVNTQTKVVIICPTHGVFEQIPSNHLKGYGCRKCSNGNSVSSYEYELLNFISIHQDDVIMNKSPDFFPNNQHLDIYIPDLKLAFEFNGDHWHTDEFGRGEDYHWNKFDWCRQAGILLVHVWQSQWNDRNSDVKRIIKTVVENKYTIDTIPEDIFSKVKEMVWLK